MKRLTVYIQNLIAHMKTSSCGWHTIKDGANEDLVVVRDVVGLTIRNACAVGRTNGKFLRDDEFAARQLRNCRAKEQIIAGSARVTRTTSARSGVSKIEARLSYVDDKTLFYLAEVLKVPVQDFFPTRMPGNRSLNSCKS